MPSLEYMKPAPMAASAKHAVDVKMLIHWLLATIGKAKNRTLPIASPAQPDDEIFGTISISSGKSELAAGIHRQQHNDGNDVGRHGANCLERI